MIRKTPYSKSSGGRRPTQVVSTWAHEWGGLCSVRLAVAVLGGLCQSDSDAHQLPSTAVAIVDQQLCRWAWALRSLMKARVFAATAPAISFLDKGPRWMYWQAEGTTNRYRREEYEGPLESVRVHVDLEGVWWTARIPHLSVTLETTLLRYEELGTIPPAARMIAENERLDPGASSSLLGLLPDLFSAIRVTRAASTEDTETVRALRSLTRSMPKAVSRVRGALVARSHSKRLPRKKSR